MVLCSEQQMMAESSDDGDEPFKRWN